MTPAHSAAERTTADASPQHAPFFGRQEHFPRTASTNDVVAAWLQGGEVEVCLATADEQTKGRGREGRTWQAPAGSSLLLSLGFRPTWLAPERTWQLAAIVPLAMADAAEEVAGLSDGVVRLKWPNDLVIEFERQAPPGAPEGTTAATESMVRKVAGVLGETSGLGTHDPRAVVGIGINADWRREDFPPELADGMTSLRDASGGRPVDRVQLLDAFLVRVEARVEGLRKGHFALSDWQDRQVTTGRLVDLVHHDQTRVTVRALGVDSHSGGLIIEEDGRERILHSAEILHVRLTAGLGV